LLGAAQRWRAIAEKTEKIDALQRRHAAIGRHASVSAWAAPSRLAA
jgi:hypothetical protein